MSRTRSIIKLVCLLVVGSGGYTLSLGATVAKECYRTECATLNGTRYCDTIQIDCNA